MKADPPTSQLEEAVTKLMRSNVDSEVEAKCLQILEEELAKIEASNENMID